MQTLVREAPQKKIDSLAEKLGRKKTNSNQQRYILECLKTISTPEALDQVKKFIDQQAGDEASMTYARDMVTGPVDKQVTRDLFTRLPVAFRNEYEEQAEYILIPAGEFKYSVSEKNEPVANVYFAKYPVTNRLYRKFILYLEGMDAALEPVLPLLEFHGKLSEFASTIKNYHEFLETDARLWPDKLRSNEDANKRFNQDDQPVVSISWFAARAYCFWLSCLQTTQDGDPKLQDVDKIAEIYRLPTELEWEWAAAGRESDGSLREYPWPEKKGKEPNEKLANYGSNVDATTPVGRYPEGATPEGLQDMAGNVFEWMQNWYDDDDEEMRALRGGSWYYDPEGLQCGARNRSNPDGRVSYDGFRVVCLQS